MALAGRLGGVAALDPHNGEILALAGVAFSAPQPPGSTFKIVTAAAALEDRKVKLSDEFPVETAATIDGVELANANGESCGGDFANSFAHSCNSVFAPLGVDVGAERLVAEAEQFGWNEDPGIPGALPSTIPAADKIVSPLEVGSTAIGQFQTLATTLQMASVAQTIANGGVRVKPTLFPRLRHAEAACRAVPADVAKTVQKLMVGVVEYGTGTLAQVDGVAVAGQDRHRRARRHPRRRPRGGPARRRPDQHRRLVHRLRPGRQAARRRIRATGPQRRRRLHRRPSRSGRPRRRPQTRLRREASILEVEEEALGLGRMAGDCRGW